jgi:hypothetical protein
VGWVAGGANSSSKAFGISFADRPKAKIVLFIFHCQNNILGFCASVIW